MGLLSKQIGRLIENMKKRFRCDKKFKAIIFLALALTTVVYCYSQNNWIKVEHIKVEINNLPKELNGLKIAHISDVHLPKNASNIDVIVNKVKQQRPDIIVMTGDLIDASADLKTCGLDRLCIGLAEIAKTYAVTGNHEIWNGNLNEWTNILTKNKVEVLDNETKTYTKNNKSIEVIGLMEGSDYKLLNPKDIENSKDAPRILLTHRPELFAYYSSDLNIINPDIVFSGHAHGGQVRIPFINKGLFSPNQDLFPRYTSGIYTNNGVKMIVSRGLGNSVIPIRINNRPHLPIIELIGVSP
ncbi:metallophosphoesterase [Clostridium sp. CS001]|uniref:metallophosphoesterase n=1 Tax=Clostridium sp. CS001 TaxID=2880648 RepID=UPI001CF15B74|nr:metallophosphoesterase [Clostridium sp. CS001]MCB2288575.1 metallophosphoesterase [Clostridium sp. CS001]